MKKTRRSRFLSVLLTLVLLLGNIGSGTIVYAAPEQLSAAEIDLPADDDLSMDPSVRNTDEAEPAKVPETETAESVGNKASDAISDASDVTSADFSEEAARNQTGGTEENSDSSTGAAAEISNAETTTEDGTNPAEDNDPAAGAADQNQSDNDKSISAVLKDEKKGVSVYLPEGMDGDSVELRVKDIETTKRNTYIAKLEADNSAVLFAYDISLIDRTSQKEIQPESKVKVEVTLSANTKINEVKGIVYRVDSGDNMKKLTGKLERDAEDQSVRLYFETEHFTPFIALDQAALEKLSAENEPDQEDRADAKANNADADEEEADAEEEIDLNAKVDITANIVPFGTEEEQNDVCTLLNLSNTRIQLRLCRKSNETDAFSTVSTTGYIYLNDPDNFTYKWSEQPKYDTEGNEYIYGVRYYYSTYSTYFPYSALTFDPAYGQMLTAAEGTENSFELRISPKSSTVQAVVKWDDNNYMETRPESIAGIRLNYGDADNTMIPTSIVDNEDGSSTVTWENVPHIYDGKTAAIYFEQPYLDQANYITTVSGRRYYDSRYIITNKLDTLRMTARLNNRSYSAITKNMAEKGGFTLPADVTATVCKNGKPVEGLSYTFRVGEGGSWNTGSISYTFVVPISERDDEAEWTVSWEDPFDSGKFITEEKAVTGSGRNLTAEKTVTYSYKVENVPDYYAYEMKLTEANRNSAETYSTLQAELTLKLKT